jgi:pyridoxamine 5'-phosphate oxidase
MRRTYDFTGGLVEEDLAATWLEQFERWLDEVVRSDRLVEPNAMVLATAGPDCHPSARTVLLKGVDERGFVLYTNLESRKGRDALANPHAALVFDWIELGRQVVVTGAIERLGDAESDAYFASRPRGSQIGAHASRQSSVIASRDELDETCVLGWPARGAGHRRVLGRPAEPAARPAALPAGRRGRSGAAQRRRRRGRSRLDRRAARTLTWAASRA